MSSLSEFGVGNLINSHSKKTVDDFQDLDCNDPMVARTNLDLF